MTKKMHARVKSKANLKLLKKNLKIREMKKREKKKNKDSYGTVFYMVATTVFGLTLFAIYKLFNSIN